MNKRFFGCAIALVALASVVSAQEYHRAPAGTTFTQVNPQNGGTEVYRNDFPQPDPLCGSTCDGCGDFYVTQIWTAPGATGDRRYVSDDITLGVGPRQLVRYDFMVCGSNAASTPVNVTSELWTINVSGLPGAEPGEPIAGTSAVTAITIDPTFPCYIITMKPAPGIFLPESLHLVITNDFQAGAFPVGTFVAVLDLPEYGSSLNQFRRTITGLAAPDPNDNADWRPPSAFAAAGPFCPPPGGADCTTGCLPYSTIWAHIYTEGSCGNGTVDPGEQCDDGGACCLNCLISPGGTSCRGSAGVCDVAEFCDGVSTACPADVVVGAGTPCRPALGPCDLAEDCDGINAACPADAGITTCIDNDGCCPNLCDGNTDNDCPPVVGVPTVSEWGLAILTLIGLVVGTILFSRKRSIATG